MDPGDPTPIIIIIEKIITLEPEKASIIIGYFMFQKMEQTELLRLAFGPNSLIQDFCRKAKSSELSDWGYLPSKGSSLNPNARPFNTNDQSLSQSSQRNQNLSRNPDIPLYPSLIRNNPNSNSSLFHGGSSQFPFPLNKNPFDNLHKRSFSENDAFLESEQQRMIAARGSPMSNIQGSGQFGVEGDYVSPSENIAQPQQQTVIAASGSPMSNIQGSGQFGVEGGYVSPSENIAQPQQQTVIAASGSPMSNIQGSGQFGVEGGYVSPSENIAQPQQQRVIAASGSPVSNMDQQQQLDQQLEGGNYSPSSSPSGPVMFSNETQENKSIHDHQHFPIKSLIHFPSLGTKVHIDSGRKHNRKVAAINKERGHSNVFYEGQETSLENTLPGSLIDSETRQTESDTEQNKEGSSDQSA